MRKKGRNAPSEPVFSGPGVSELLKTTRERAGGDLQTVSQVLRIRHVYLEAIEAGNYDELPGKTYVVGFVRAYAEYLGLDSEEVVKRFKLEVDGLSGSAELVFPSPVTEQSVPGGAIFLISLIILSAAYGGWYFLSTQDRSMAELVPDFPAKFAELMDKVKEKKQQPVTPEVEISDSIEDRVEPSVEVPDTQDMAQKALEAVEEAKTKEDEEAKNVEVPAVEVIVKKIKEVVAELPKVEAIKTKKVAAVSAPAPAQEREKQVVSSPSEEMEQASEVVEAVEPEEEKVVEPAKPQAMSEKVVLKALDYSWIQVTDSEGKVLHTQVLNEGDEYQIPATQGLILRTGNAGGLEVFVDGEKVPGVGDSGQVRRKIFMDPAKLIAGKAVDS